DRKSACDNFPRRNMKAAVSAAFFLPACQPLHARLCLHACRKSALSCFSRSENPGFSGWELVTSGITISLVNGYSMITDLFRHWPVPWNGLFFARVMLVRSQTKKSAGFAH